MLTNRTRSGRVFPPDGMVSALQVSDLDSVCERLRNFLTRLAPAQDHLLNGWNELTEQDRLRLAREIDSVDFRAISRSVDSSPVVRREVDPPVVADADDSDAERMACAGEGAIRAGRIGAAILAGGLGTRLGFDGPKALYPIGPVSKKPLLRFLLEKVVAVGRLHRVRIPVLIMTGSSTHGAIVDYLEKTEGCGVAADDLFVFPQRELPVADVESGKLLLKFPGQLAMCPDGHGGFLKAAAESDALKHMAERGVQTLNTCQVDNPLAPLLDPAIIGRHLVARAEATTVAVQKTSGTERMGTLVQVNETSRVIEYSELPESLANVREPSGRLRFEMGNIGVHIFEVEFLQRISSSHDALPLHRCRRPVLGLWSGKNLPAQSVQQAVKFERFIFDLLPLAQSSLLINAERSSVFAPVKTNDPDDIDTPDRARTMMQSVYRRWFAERGVTIPQARPVEISPLFSVDSRQFRRQPVPAFGPGPIYVEANSER